MGLFRQHDDHLHGWRTIIGCSIVFSQMAGNYSNILHPIFFDGCRINATRAFAQK